MSKPEFREPRPAILIPEPIVSTGLRHPRPPLLPNSANGRGYVSVERALELATIEQLRAELRRRGEA